MRRKMAAGNWKMNGTKAHLDQLAQLAHLHTDPSVDLVVCPPATLISRSADQTAGGPIAIGAQDCHVASSGAHTGDVAANMLKDAGATYVLAGHSERRADHLETDTAVCAKADAAIAQRLVAIICVGETLQAREAGKTLEVIGAQLAGSVPETANGSTTVIAYEPVWAIGTGQVASPGQIGEVHQFIRHSLNTRFGANAGTGFRLIYGGSVKASNAAEIFAIQDVDGALVGGASLRAADFSPIITALEAS
ncbi:MAG: triose-phosphate isomerase [Paracoccaceae bacterium]|nr:triose-phosphate isomerase [Paracoccaceae bacterium]